MKLSKVVALTVLGCFALPIVAEAKAKAKKMPAKKHGAVECMAPMKPAVSASTTPDGYMKVKDNLFVGIHGYVQGIMNYDFKGFGGDYISADKIPYDDGKPANKKESVLSMHAKQTRLGIYSLAKTSIGDVKGRVEFDFYKDQDLANTANPSTTTSHAFRMRHAYLEACGWLVGQTDSLFTTIHEVPSLNFADHFGGGRRHFQVRYTYDFNDMFNLAVALEQPESDGISPAGVDRSFYKEQKLPDFTMKTTYMMDGHSIDLRGVLRSVSFKSANMNKSKSKMGWGLGTNMKFQYMNGSNLIGMVNYGQGIGRYISEHNGQSVVVDFIKDKIENQKILEWGAGISHMLADEWQVNLGYSQSRVTNAKLRTANNTDTKMLDRMFANVMWMPVKDLKVGLEFMQGRRKSMTNGANTEQKGTRNRVTVGVQYKF